MAKKKDTPPVIQFSKGPRTEVVTMGEGEDAAKLTLRGLTYREVCYLKSIAGYQSDVEQFRIGLTAVENLKAPNDKGEIETANLRWENGNIDGKATPMLNAADYEEWFEGNTLVIGQVLHVINDLTVVKPNQSQAVRIFRQNE